MAFVIHSADDGTIVDAATCFVYDVPDEVASDMEALEQWLVENLEDGRWVLSLVKEY
jgi:hypothetical protein